MATCRPRHHRSLTGVALRDVAFGGAQVAHQFATPAGPQATSARTAHCWESWKAWCAWKVGAIPRSATRAGRGIAGPRPPQRAAR